MNWRAVAFIVIASALLQAVAAATPVQRPLAVVHPLQALGRVDRFLLKALGEEVRTALLKTGAYRLLDSSALERGLKGLTACRKGAHARSCHLAAGRFLSASSSITGMVTRLSDRTHYLSLVVVYDNFKLSRSFWICILRHHCLTAMFMVFEMNVD